MKEYLIKYAIHTTWNSKGGEVTSNCETEVVSANTASDATKIVFGWYKNILNMPTKELEILSVKLIG